MNNKLYIGNLPFTADEQQLREVFGADGRQVASVKIMMDRETGRPRGFAFVEMATEEDAQKAIAALHNQDFMGRPLTVNEAREPAPRGPGGFGGPRPGGFGGAPSGAPSRGPIPNGPGGPPPRPAGPGGFSGPRPGGGGGFSGPRPGGGGGFGAPRPSGGGGFDGPPPESAEGNGGGGRGRDRQLSKDKDRDRRKRGKDDDWS
jgi:RNA recognition motif-containing protein